MNIFQAIVLGLVQGFTEFLPVSSSGHLVLLQDVMHLSNELVAFDVLLHLASLAAVVICLRKELFALIKKPFQPTTFNLAIATFPAALIGLLLHDFIEESFGGGYLGFGFLFTAVLLVVADVCSPKAARLSRNTTPLCAAVMGVGQAIAMLPGISRSGTTIASGMIYGVNKEDCARFSFLMSIPIILASAAFKLPKLSFTQNPLPLILGALAAFFSALLSIKVMLSLVKKRRFFGFSIYLAALATVVLLNQHVFMWW